MTTIFSTTRKINLLKKNALKLYVNKQLPSRLAYMINNINVDTSEKFINSLMFLTDKYLRVVGYYKRYPKEEEIANNYVSNFFRKEFK